MRYIGRTVFRNCSVMVAKQGTNLDDIFQSEAARRTGDNPHELLGVLVVNRHVVFHFELERSVRGNASSSSYQAIGT